MEGLDRLILLYFGTGFSGFRQLVQFSGASLQVAVLVVPGNCKPESDFFSGTRRLLSRIRVPAYLLTGFEPPADYIRGRLYFQPGI